MLRRVVFSLALIASIAGCGGPREPAAPAAAKPWKRTPAAGTSSSQEQEQEPAQGNQQPPRIGDHQDDPEASEKQPATSIDPSEAESPAPSAADSIDASGDRTYNTGDCDDWPSYELPLVIEIEILKFPEEVTRRADPIPDEEE
jgi:hypothetical protein